MAEIPESLLRRSAEAKAKALGLPVEQVLAEMKGEVPPAPVSAVRRNRRLRRRRRQTPDARRQTAEPRDPPEAATPEAETPEVEAPRRGGDAGARRSRRGRPGPRKLPSLRSHPPEPEPAPEPEPKNWSPWLLPLPTHHPHHQNSPPAPEAPASRTTAPPKPDHRRRSAFEAPTGPATDRATGNGRHWFSPGRWLLRPVFPRGCVPSVFSPSSRRGRSSRSRPSPPTRSTPGLT